MTCFVDMLNADILYQCRAFAKNHMGGICAEGNTSLHVNTVPIPLAIISMTFMTTRSFCPYNHGDGLPITGSKGNHECRLLFQIETLLRRPSSTHLAIVANVGHRESESHPNWGVRPVIVVNVMICQQIHHYVMTIMTFWTRQQFHNLHDQAPWVSVPSS